MPYLKVLDRFQLDNKERGPKCAGDLNYLITCLCLDYWHANGSRYAQINDIVGALECAKLEFARRLAGPYENSAIQKNGDVYDVYPINPEAH